MAAVDDVDEVFEQYHLAAGEFVKGRPQRAQKLFSHREDVTLANPQALPCVDGSRLLRQWSVPHRLAEMARALASRS
jgi:hypothetical protein